MLKSLVHLARTLEFTDSFQELVLSMLEFIRSYLQAEGVAFVDRSGVRLYVGEVPKEGIQFFDSEEVSLKPCWIPIKGKGMVIGGIVIPRLMEKLPISFLEILSEMASLGFSLLEVREDRKFSVVIEEDRISPHGLGSIIGKSPKMLEVFDLIRKVAPTKANILIRGESGTGKELVAKTLHMLSVRKNSPFVKINCAAIPETLLESELFGVERGTATGVLQRIGKFEQADKGTIFLDEIGDMSLNTQAKILRVLQEREFERVGGRKTIEVDVRIIAATNKDLEEKIRNGTFREDLFYRLNVVTLWLPPLRERTEDIPLLVKHFVKIFRREYGKDIEGVSREAMRRLKAYHWPGNVRELENCIERAVVLADTPMIQVKDLPVLLQAPAMSSLKGVASLKSAKSQVEKHLIFSSLKRNNWNVTRTAEELGITRRQLYRLMDKYGIKRSGILS